MKRLLEPAPWSALAYAWRPLGGDPIAPVSGADGELRLEDSRAYVYWSAHNLAEFEHFFVSRFLRTKFLQFD